MVAMAVVLGLVCVLSVVLCTELRRSKVPPSAASAVNPVPDGSMSMMGATNSVRFRRLSRLFGHDGTGYWVLVDGTEHSPSAQNQETESASPSNSRCYRFLL